MTGIIVVLAICLSYWRFRNLYYNNLALRHQLRLYRLRDKVRLYAIQKKIKAHDVFFDYLDRSTCKTIQELPYLNLLGVIYLHSRHRNDVKTEEVKKMIADATENEYARELFEEYGVIVMQYIVQKHYIIYFLIRCLDKIFTQLKGIRHKYFLASEAIKATRIFPETSASAELA